jgi:hypothetical protein
MIDVAGLDSAVRGGLEKGVCAGSRPDATLSLRPRIDLHHSEQPEFVRP